MPRRVSFAFVRAAAKGTRYWAGVAALAGITAAAAGDGVVAKTVEAFQTPAWRMNQWNKAGGAVRRVEDDAPPGARGDDSVAAVARFSGGGFEYWTFEPTAPIVVPGRLRTVSVWVKRDDNAEAYGLSMLFNDAYGRGKVDGRDLKWDMRDIDTEWKQLRFTVPDEWVAPIQIMGFNSHNWGQDKDKREATWQFGGLAVETDMAGVDPETGFPPDFAPNEAADKPENRAPAPIKLFDLALTTDETANVFAGAVPTLRVTARSWLADAVDVDLAVRVASLTDPGVAPVDLPRQTLPVADVAALAIPHQPPRYGVYEVTASARRADGWKQDFATRFAYLPAPRELTDAQRDASPYGLNVHGGRAVYVTPFTKAGVVWFRDYAFTYDWMARAKGDNHRYEGWPYVRQNTNRYVAEKARLLACFQGALNKLTPEEIRAGARPTRAWLGEIVDAVRAFPDVAAWELDNEYELHGGRAQAEREGDWKTYQNYHRAFGAAVDAVTLGEALAVENGRAGIEPGLVRDAVLAGAFDHIQVVNSHNYCGAEPPEASYANMNFHQDADELRQSACLLYDRLRETTRAARADGKPRRHWLTEFGWDTKAGHVVSPATQAAYLPRAYMLQLSADTEKGFWFFDLDGDQASNFFDGCGLLAMGPDHLPKPSLAAMAGLAHALPSPEYVGMTFAGVGTWGYVFRQDGAYVVALWTVADAADGPEVDLPAARVLDAFANPLPQGKQRLRQAPTYWIGVPADSPVVRAARFGVETRMLVLACAGDSFAVELTARGLPGGTAPAAFDAAMDLPAGWSFDASAPAVVGDDGVARKAVTVKVDPNATLADLSFTLRVSENGAPAAALPLRVLVQPALSLSVTALGREPGQETVTATVVNRAKRAVRGRFTLDLPAGWSAERAEIPLAALEPGASRDVPVTLAWAADALNADDADGGAALVLAADDGSRVRRPLIPGRIAIARGQGLALDGDPSAWPAATRLPGWIFGSTQSEPQADLWLAWAPEGIYIGARVRDSILRVQTPQSFWSGDALEFFLDLADRADDAFVKGRHQFWIVPQPDKEGGAPYVGRWKRGEEIDAIRQPLPGVRGRSVRMADGYAYTLLLPAAVLDGWNPKAGDAIGLNLNLSVRGRQFDREVFWPLSKAKEESSRPSRWGRVALQ